MRRDLTSIPQVCGWWDFPPVFLDFDQARDPPASVGLFWQL